MEVLSRASDKRTVLAAVDEGDAASELCRGLERHFNVVRCATADDALLIMNERLNDLSATVIGASLASADDYGFLRAVSEARYFDTIPVVVVVDGTATDEDIRCFSLGAVDVVELPCTPAILERRIDNAIKIRRSATFYEIESMLRVLPSMVFLKDAEGRYVFSTQYWHHLETGNDPKWTIRGKTDIDIRKDKENAKLAMEADEEILRTGKGTSYVVEINADGVQDFVQLIKEPIFDEDGNVAGIIALANDVTEFELMKRKLAQYARIDELTGLGNRRAFNEFLESVPSRDDFPIAIISADCDGLKAVNDSFGHLVGDEYIHMAAIVLRAGIPDGTLAFRVGGDEFVAFVPGADVEQAQVLVETMRDKAEYFRLSRGEAVVSYGVAAIEAPDVDIKAVLDLADQRMYQDKSSHKNRT